MVAPSSAHAGGRVTPDRGFSHKWAVLDVQQELAASLELAMDARMTEAENQPVQPVVSSVKEPETPNVNWAGIPKNLHVNMQVFLDKLKGL